MSSGSLCTVTSLDACAAATNVTSTDDVALGSMSPLEGLASGSGYQMYTRYASGMLEFPGFADFLSGCAVMGPARPSSLTDNAGNATVNFKITAGASGYYSFFFLSGYQISALSDLFLLSNKISAVSANGLPDAQIQELNPKHSVSFKMPSSFGVTITNALGQTADPTSPPTAFVPACFVTVFIHHRWVVTFCALVFAFMVPQVTCFYVNCYISSVAFGFDQHFEHFNKRNNNGVP